MGNEDRKTNIEAAITSKTKKEDKKHRNPMKWKDPKKTTEDKSEKSGRNKSEDIG